MMKFNIKLYKVVYESLCDNDPIKKILKINLKINLIEKFFFSLDKFNILK